MKFSVYVHDLQYEVGHSNVTIDMINNLPKNEDYEFKFICFTYDSAKKLFPKIHERISFHKVPFQNIRPVLIKVIFFQIYTFMYSLFFDRKRTKISLGVSNLNCDLNIIHFIHNQWDPIYFNTLTPSGIKHLYKKMFFIYTNFCETLLFKLVKPKTITVSKFLSDYIINKFNYCDNRITHIHSGFDLKRFNSSQYSQKESLQILQNEYKDLDNLSLEKPIALFVGAFERKGLSVLLEQWKKVDSNTQLIIIGKPESKQDIDFTSFKNVFYVPFTNKINLFYEISDYFFFPTIYEPFGMVLIEAAVKGLKIYSTQTNVGASEVLNNLEEIILYNNHKDFEVPTELSKLDSKQRENLIRERIQKLSKYNWKNISNEYNSYLKCL